MCNGVAMPVRLGAYIRHRRETLGLGLNELARLAGVEPAVLHRLETGKQKGAQPHNLRGIAEALDMSVEEMLAEAADMSVDEYQRLTGRPGFADYLAGDPYLDDRERDALVRTYDALRGSRRPGGGAPASS